MKKLEYWDAANFAWMEVMYLSCYSGKRPDVKKTTFKGCQHKMKKNVDIKLSWILCSRRRLLLFPGSKKQVECIQSQFQTESKNAFKQKKEKECGCFYKRFAAALNIQMPQTKRGRPFKSFGCHFERLSYILFMFRSTLLILYLSKSFIQQ